MSQTTKTDKRIYENAEGRRLFMFVFNVDFMTPLVANNAFDAYMGINTETVDQLNTLAETMKKLGMDNHTIENSLHDALRFLGFEECWSPENAIA